jgi:uncharacterized protein
VLGQLAAVFAVGLLGGAHCVGMCGGIVAALTVRMPGERPRRSLTFAYNAGRVATYATLGALAGGLGSLALLADGVLPVQISLYVLAQLMLLALGLYLLGVPRWIAPFERAGARLWRHLQPRARALFPVRTPARAVAVGALWGLVPCGLVYSVLATAILSGSAAGGALVMAAFGLGTLPALLAAGEVLPALERVRRAPWTRRAAGGAVIAFGLAGLAGAAHLDPLAGVALLCRTVTG